jgi:hypothetical protein
MAVVSRMCRGCLASDLVETLRHLAEIRREEVAVGLEGDLGELCPSCLATTTGDVPERMSTDAQKCRRSWGRSSEGAVTFSIAGRQICECQLLALKGRPVFVVNNNTSGSFETVPRCSASCSLRTAGSERVRSRCVFVVSK